MRIKKILFFSLFLNFVFFNTLPRTIDPQEPIQLQFYGKNLGDLLQKIAEIKNANILLPSGSDQINVTVNFSTPQALPAQELEEYLLYFIDMAGYRLSVQGDILVVTKKTDASINRMPMPLYVDVDPKMLPDNPGPIRAMYFLKNIKVHGNNTITKIIYDILPDSRSALVDPRSNCIILTGPANTIAAAMTIITELDNYGLRDEVAVLRLLHTSAAVIAKLMDEIIGINKDSNPVAASSPLYTGGVHFPPGVKIIPELRTNSLIFMGKSPAINKIINFIQEDLDLPQESGKCIVHVYTLKYLDAKRTAPILQSLVSGKTQSGQSIRDSAATPSYYRFFDSVRIIAEQTMPSQVSGKDSNTQSKVTLGGNRLIIAATHEDYKEIESIIQRIDKPQHQVIIEVLILDLGIDKTGNYSSQFRLPALINSLTNIGMQTVMQDNSQIIINDPTSGNTAVTTPAGLTPQSTITSDLLSTITSGASAGGAGGGSDQSGSSSTQSLVDNVPRTGMIISLGEQFKNIGIAALLNFADNIYSRNIVVNQSVVTQNNIKTEIKSVQVRRGEGQISSDSSKYGGATVVNIESYAAALGINLTPRISRISYSSDDNEEKTQKLNLEIDINIEEFKNSSASNYDKITRSVKTNVNIGSGDLLIFGGLYKKGRTKSISKTPILGDIPLIGTLFRNSTYEDNDEELVVIMRTTIVEPVSGNSLQHFTDKKMRIAQEELEESVLGKIKDPITRVYFEKSKHAESPFDDMFKKPHTLEYYDEKRNKTIQQQENRIKALYQEAKNPFIAAA